MTSLICLVCRCNLSDGRLIRENEQFDVNEREAEILTRGGIAKYAPTPVIIPEDMPAQEPIAVSSTPPEPEPPSKPTGRKRKQGAVMYV
jgi:hypothetical protein